MKLLLALAAAFLAFATPAVAQTAPTQQHLDAARTMLHVMLVETGSLEAGSMRSIELLAPRFKESVRAAPFFQAASPAHQEATLAYFDRFSAIGTREVVENAPAIYDRFAPRLAAIFTEPELRDIIDFCRTPEGRSMFVRGVVQGVNEGAGVSPGALQPTPAELEAAGRFGQTAGGRAWTSNAETFNVLLNELGEQAVMNALPRVRARIAHDLCVILEDECPADMRVAGASAS